MNKSINESNSNIIFNKRELETILYSLEGYIQGNDDIELVDELVDICYKLESEIEELLTTNKEQSSWLIAKNMMTY